MKQGFSCLCAIFVTASLFLSACGKSENTEVNSTSCLTGTWKVVESGKILRFIFNQDKTGFEKQGDDSPGNFTWEIRDNHPVIKYNGQTQEWTFTLNCKKNHLKIMGLTYSRE